MKITYVFKCNVKVKISDASVLTLRTPIELFISIILYYQAFFKD